MENENMDAARKRQTEQEAKVDRITSSFMAYRNRLQFGQKNGPGDTNIVAALLVVAEEIGELSTTISRSFFDMWDYYPVS